MSFWDDLQGYVSDASSTIDSIQSGVTNFLNSSPIGALVTITQTPKSSGAISPAQSQPAGAPVTVAPAVQTVGGVDMKVPLMALGGVLVLALIMRGRR